MLKAERIVTYLLCAALIAIVAWMKICTPDAPTKERIVIREHKVHDTLITPGEDRYFQLPSKKVIYRDTIEKIVIGTDTVPVKPFVAKADTSFLCLDSLNLAFMYPQMVFTLHAKSRPDTVVQTTILKDSVIFDDKRSVWEDIATHAGAVLVGFLLGRTK